MRTWPALLTAEAKLCPFEKRVALVRCLEALPKEEITTKDTKSTKDGIKRFVLCFFSFVSFVVVLCRRDFIVGVDWLAILT